MKVATFFWTGLWLKQVLSVSQAIVEGMRYRREGEK